MFHENMAFEPIGHPNFLIQNVALQDQQVGQDELVGVTLSCVWLRLHVHEGWIIFLMTRMEQP